MKTILTYLDGSDPLESSPILVFPNDDAISTDVTYQSVLVTSIARSGVESYTTPPTYDSLFYPTNAAPYDYYSDKKHPSGHLWISPQYKLILGTSSWAWLDPCGPWICPVQTRLKARKSVKVLSYFSTSESQLIGSTWKEGAQLTTTNCYVWMKIVVSYNDGTPDLESRPIPVRQQKLGSGY